MKGAYYTFVGWQDITGTYYEREKYDITSADVVLYALWMLEAPEIDTVVPEDKVITGQGEPNAMVDVTFPDGSITTTIVDNDGNWSLDVPEGTEINLGDTIKAAQSDDEGRRSKESDETVWSSVPEDTDNTDINIEDNTGSNTREPEEAPNTEDINLNGNDTDTGTGVDLSTEGETGLGSENVEVGEGLDETNETGDTEKIEMPDDTTPTPSKPLVPDEVSNPPTISNAIADSSRPPDNLYNGSNNPVTAVYNDEGFYIIYDENEVPMGFVVVPENESIETVILDEYMIPLGAPDIYERLDEQLKIASGSAERKANPSTGYYENTNGLSLKLGFCIVEALIILMSVMLNAISRKRHK